ncbi:hypothetical protein Q7P37_001222 [Cladosporium fusiforme]
MTPLQILPAETRHIASATTPSHLHRNPLPAKGNGATMGRRPNAVVGEFFHRGQKLDDSSNRYQHTCKKCGEHFSKGRIDGMLGHLLKRCPNMTQEDRNLAFLHMQNNSSGPAKAKKQNAASQNSTQAMGYAPQHVEQIQAMPDIPVEHRQQMGPQVTSQQMPQQMPQQMHQHMPQHAPQQAHQMAQQVATPDLPLHMLMQRQQSALDTLAEVSRRHLDYSVHKDGFVGDPQEASLLRQSDRVLVEQALLAALQRPDAHNNDPSAFGESSSMPMYTSYENHEQAQSGAVQPSFTEPPRTAPLVNTATAANHHLEQTRYEDDVAPIDPQLDSQMDGTVDISTAPSHEAPPQTQTDFMSWTETPQEFVTQQDLPSNEPNPEFGLLHKTDKSNARSRFTDTRRKEVQEIRKRGACMRCRMLKKPCSEGTPCGTCKKIDAARLWKGTCLRTKLSEEFTLYSTSYFHSQAVDKVSNAVQTMTNTPLPGRMEIKLLPDSTLAMTLSTKRYSSATTQGLGQRLQSNGVPHTNDVQDIVVLDDGMASQKLSAYATRDVVIRECIENERSVFLQTTLREATSLLEAEQAKSAPSNQKSETRTNHISPSVLLKNVIELWIETSFLVSKHHDGLEIRYNSNMLASQDPQEVVWSDDGAQSSFTLPLGSTSHQVVRAQLLAATETACHRLSKAVMNELERRLLQRQQVSAYATFISAVILLSCVERITAFYHSLGQSQFAGSGTEGSVGMEQPCPQSDMRPPSYPLSLSAPSALWPQGPHFARLLTTLLRMRALPPKTTRTVTNKLAVLQEPGMPVRLNGVAVREQQDENTAKAARWLDLLNLDVDDLLTRRDGEISQPGWDLRFVSAILLGEGM